VHARRAGHLWMPVCVDALKAAANSRPQIASRLCVLHSHQRRASSSAHSDDSHRAITTNIISMMSAILHNHRSKFMLGAPLKSSAALSLAVIDRQNTCRPARRLIAVA
jgi:hypothetical protein